MARARGLQAGSGSEAGEEFAGKIGGFEGVVAILTTDVVVEELPFGGAVDVGKAEIHAVPLNGACAPADKRDGAVLVLPFDDADVGERVVRLAVAVEVPCVVEKDEIARPGGRSLMELAMLPDVVVDQPDAVGFRVRTPALIQIDAMFEEHGPGDPGAIVLDPVAVDFDRACADQSRRGPHDGRAAGSSLDRSAAAGRRGSRRLFFGCAAASDQRRNGDDDSDEEQARHERFRSSKTMRVPYHGGQGQPRKRLFCARNLSVCSM